MRLLWSILLLHFAAALANGVPIEMPAKELAAAKKIYSAKCGRCHEFYEPRAYNNAEWNQWMTKMVKKSRLKKEQTELLTRYTETLRTESKQTGNGRADPSR